MALLVADFDSDGKLDAATDSWGNNQIEILRGDGTGRLLTPGIFFTTGRRPYERLRTADFNHDGQPVIVTTNLDDDNVSILLGDGRGGLKNAPGSPFPAGAKPWEVAVYDLNGDGDPDLIIIPYQRDVSRQAENAVSILLGDGHGGFRLHARLTAASGRLSRRQQRRRRRPYWRRNTHNSGLLRGEPDDPYLPATRSWTIHGDNPPHCRRLGIRHCYRAP